jgi:hypothetical protein
MLKLLSSSIIIILSFNACSSTVSSDGYGFGYKKNILYNDLPPHIKKEQFEKKYEDLPYHKAFAFATSKVTGYYTYGICSGGDTMKDAKNCALKECQKNIKEFMKIKNNQCKIYAQNAKIVWK